MCGDGIWYVEHWSQIVAINVFSSFTFNVVFLSWVHPSKAKLIGYVPMTRPNAENCSLLVMATISKRSEAKASIMVLSLILKRSEHV